MVDDDDGEDSGMSPVNIYGRSVARCSSDIETRLVDINGSDRQRELESPPARTDKESACEDGCRRDDDDDRYGYASLGGVLQMHFLLDISLLRRIYINVYIT